MLTVALLWGGLHGGVGTTMVGACPAVTEGRDNVKNQEAKERGRAGLAPFLTILSEN